MSELKKCFTIIYSSKLSMTTKIGLERNACATKMEWKICLIFYEEKIAFQTHVSLHRMSKIDRKIETTVKKDYNSYVTTTTCNNSFFKQYQQRGRRRRKRISTKILSEILGICVLASKISLWSALQKSEISQHSSSRSSRRYSSRPASSSEPPIMAAHWSLFLGMF